MHEFGIIFNIIKSVKKVVLENNVKHVESVTLDIGEVSTVIPSYLEDCWNWAYKKRRYYGRCKINL